MKEIIFFHPSNNYTGSTRVLCDTIEEEYPDGEVVVVTKNINNSGFISDNKRIKIISVYFPLNNARLIKLISPILSNFHLFILAIFYGWRYKTFYINTITPSSATLAGKLMGKNIIYHIHEKFILDSIRTRLKEYIFNHTNATRIFVSEYTKNQYPLKPYPTIIRYNKLSKDFISKVNITPIEERSLKRIIMISSFSRAKGVYTYIELAKHMPEYKFTLIVSAEQQEINDITSTIPNNLTIYPNQKDIHPFLQNADLILNLSIPDLCIETFGMTIIEAMAYGIPAIVPNIGGPIEIIRNGYNGYCVDVTNLQDLQTKIKRTLNKKNYSILAINALERIKIFTHK